MRRSFLLAMVSVLASIALVLGGCSDDDNNSKADVGTQDGSVQQDGALATDGSSGADSAEGNPYNTAAAINAYLEGKTLVMAGDDIPAYPNGYDENTNYGTATQCYSEVKMEVAAGTYTVTSQLGTLNDAPNTGDVGTCDHDTVSNEVSFSSTVVNIENVAEDGSCFDFTATFTGFAQEGRGFISPDGKTMTLELYFKDQATGHRCADGAVGSASVTLNGAAFTGDAKQIYQITE